MKTTLETFKKNVSFKDAEGKLIFVEISIEDGCLSMSGNCQGSGGQIVDQIKPANDAQRELVSIWKAWHLNDMHAGTEEQEAALNSPEFEAFKVKADKILKQIKEIESIVTGPFEGYCAFIGKPSTWSSLRHDHNNLKKVWRGEKVTLCNSSYIQTNDFFKVVNSIPEKIRPTFKYKSAVPPQVTLKMFGDNYSLKCAFLDSKAMRTVMYKGQAYTYGHAWLKLDLPADIYERLYRVIESMETFTGSPYEKQANDLLASIGVEFSAKFQRHGKHFAGEEENRDIFSCRFSRADSPRDYFTLSFGQSITNSDGHGSTPPTAYDVLACLTKSDPGTFENFCSEMGYDSDSRKAEKIYKLVCEEWRKVNQFFTDEEMQQLQNIS